MRIKTLFIDRSVAHLTKAQTFAERLGLKPVVVDGPEEVYAAVNSGEDPIRRGKEILFVTRNKGAFVRSCPGTKAYTCCGYKILHIGTYCTMDCAYCILQSYFHPPVLQYFVNHDQMDAELDALFTLDEISRIGTGEFTDSLIWELWTPLSKYLISRFARQHRAILELKTKTTAIDHLARVEHNRKTIIAWSLNTPRVIKDAERGTATLEARLRAAATCQQWNYPLAFHFDPMVIYEGCEHEYETVVDRLFETVDARQIVWISLGSFRYIPSLKSIIQRRFAHTKMVYGEFIPGLDGKMRYFQPLRTKLYQSLARRIQKRAPGVTIYFCMEDPSVWQDVLGTVPRGDAGLAHMLDESACRICGLRLD